MKSCSRKKKNYNILLGSAVNNIYIIIDWNIDDWFYELCDIFILRGCGG